MLPLFAVISSAAEPPGAAGPPAGGSLGSFPVCHRLLSLFISYKLLNMDCVTSNRVDACCN